MCIINMMLHNSFFKKNTLKSLFFLVKTPKPLSQVGYKL